MMKKLGILSLMLVLFAACNTANKSNENADAAQDSVATVDAHTSQSSLDYAGVYEGVLPCADCEGIKTNLTLNKDNTYLLQIAYQKDGKEQAPQEYKGNFSWNEAGTTVILAGIDSFNSQYLVNEGQIVVLDMNGEKIESTLADHYILKQVTKF